LGVRTVQHGDFSTRSAAIHPIANPIDHEICFVAFIERRVQLDSFSVLAARPKILSEPARVVCYQRIRSFQDGSRRTVILLELVQSRRRVVATKLIQILDTRAAPTINGLIVVADGERHALRSCEQRQPLVLNRIGILKLVYQDMPKPSLVVLQQTGVIAPELVGTEQQLGKIDHPGTTARFLVGLIDGDQLAAGRVSIVLDLLGAKAFVLLGVDEPQYFARHPARLIEVHGLQHLAQQASLVLGIQNLKTLRKSCLAPMQAQQSVREPVERPYPERAAGNTQQRFDPAAHFGCRLVREGHGENAVGRSAFDLDQPSNAVNQHACFAAAGTGKHECRRQGRGYGLPLRVVQAVE
jgi:hypothetical protein